MPLSLCDLCKKFINQRQELPVRQRTIAPVHIPGKVSEPADSSIRGVEAYRMIVEMVGEIFKPVLHVGDLEFNRIKDLRTFEFLQQIGNCTRTRKAVSVYSYYHLSIPVFLFKN